MPYFLEYLRSYLPAMPENMSPLALGGSVLLLMLWGFAQTRFTYTHGLLVATLAMVEDTSPGSIARAHLDPTASSNEPHTIEPDLRLVKPKPLAASTNGTVRHLCRIGGRLAAFRGFGLAIVCSVLGDLLKSGIVLLAGRFLSAPPILSASLGSIGSQVALFRLDMLWTHVVISMPSRNRAWKRLVPYASARRVLQPTVLCAAVHAAVSALESGMVYLVYPEANAAHIEDNVPPGWTQIAKTFAGLGVVLGFSFLLWVTVSLPATVALTRCYAALLADRETPLVPLDRSCGGALLVADEARAPLSLRAAWTSFDWKARTRLLVVYARAWLYSILVFVFFSTGWVVFLAMTVRSNVKNQDAI